MPAAIAQLYPETLNGFITLSQMTRELTGTFHFQARQNKSVIVNDIPEDLYIDTDPELVASILGGVLSAVIKNAKESYITLSAKTYGNVILVHIKDHNNINYCPVENKIRQLDPIAEKIGGSVSVTSNRNNVTTFAFSFPNLPLAA